jgi:hypothetical protein
MPLTRDRTHSIGQICPDALEGDDETAADADLRPALILGSAHRPAEAVIAAMCEFSEKSHRNLLWEIPLKSPMAISIFNEAEAAELSDIALAALGQE